MQVDYAALGLVRVVIGLILLVTCHSARSADVPRVDFDRDIRPILSDRCFACHGPDQKARQGELRLDVRSAAVAAAIVPGRAEESELLRRIRSEDPDERMPPKDSRKPRLTADEVDVIRRWIDQGAAYQDHWAFAAPRRPPMPDVQDSQWPTNPIDRFIDRRLQQEGLRRSPEADRGTLIRRLSLDVIGLPPTSEEVASFVSNGRPDAYEQLVERLLASPHYGERMAIYWLDVVRYADSVGIHGDQEISMSPYRDYVINAFNENLPYDQFLTEQIAGDLLPGATPNQNIASAFNRLHMITSEGGAQEKEYLAKYAADRVRNTGTAVLGLTLGCSECHDHKFDPVTSRDFYQFEAFFADLKEQGVYAGNKWMPEMPVPTPRQEQLIHELEHKIQEVRGQPPKPSAELAELEKQLESVRKSVRTVLVSQSVEPRAMRVLPRGNWLDESGEIVQPDVPAFLRLPSVEHGRKTRIDLARWLTDVSNPLTARVMVNRLWKLAFGRGIVTTLDDFGTQGSLPSHPDLIDWLAVEFMESGWDVKHTLKSILMSRTYRQSSVGTETLRRRDPDNRLLARQNRFRLDAELIRDNALSISGLLVHKLGGRSVRPYQPAGYYAHLNFPRRTYQPDRGENLYRRGVYTHWQRTFLHPSLLAFDAPTREESCVQRPRSNTPVQSLVLLNDPIYVEAAREFAVRIIKEAGSQSTERVAFAVRNALGREARPIEVDVLTTLVKKHRQRFTEDPSRADELLRVGDKPVPVDLDPVELAAWTSVARVILNLHETITRS